MIFSKWSVCLWAKSLFLGFVCTFSATTTPLKKTNTCWLQCAPWNGTARTPHPADDHGAFFTASPRVKWRAGFEECRWDDGPVCACVWMQMCVESSATDCLPSSYVHKSMATRHCGLPALESRSFLFLLTVKKKTKKKPTATTEATSSFLDLVLSLQDSNKSIYFYISVK